MAVDGKVLQGEITENPSKEKVNLDQLLKEFLDALLSEQQGASSGESKR
jgi:hypothetical protein